MATAAVNPNKPVYYKGLTRDRGGWHDSDGVGFNYRQWELACTHIPRRERADLARNPSGRYKTAVPWALRKPTPEGVCRDDPGVVKYTLWKSIAGALGDATLPVQVFQAEPCGTLLKEDARQATYSSARVVRRVAMPEWLTLANRFVASVPKRTPFFRRSAPDPAWRVFGSLREAEAAAGTETDPAVGAAREAVRAAVAREGVDEPWSAARLAAFGPAGSSARVAARRWIGGFRDALEERLEKRHGYGRMNLRMDDPEADPVRVRPGPVEAAGSAGFESECRAGEDACLQAESQVAAGIDVADEHRRHAEQRWEVWKRGYGLFRSVKGVLFVFSKLV